MRQPLWIPSQERQAASNISRFIAELNLTHDLRISSYADLYRWSVDELSDFLGGHVGIRRGAIFPSL